MRIFNSLLACVVSAAVVAGAESPIPHLRQQGSATQLVVNGSPFLIRVGEVGNSTATSAAYLKPFWSKFKALNMNTVLAPVYWDRHLAARREKLAPELLSLWLSAGAKPAG